MRRSPLVACVIAAMLGNSSGLNAQQTVLFSTDPFAGSGAEAPGRQIVGSEPSIVFNPATDVFAFNPTFFNIGSISFANGIITAIPTTGVNVVVLQTFDNDNNTGTPFSAATAANLIADRITAPGAGLFLYFNSGLDMARLVYSTNLDDNTADLKILAQLTNLSGQTGRDAFASFTSANFQIAVVPEPSTFALAAVGLLLLGARLRMRKR